MPKKNNGGGPFPVSAYLSLLAKLKTSAICRQTRPIKGSPFIDTVKSLDVNSLTLYGWIKSMEKIRN